jgi:hypothetical protein
MCDAGFAMAREVPEPAVEQLANEVFTIARALFAFAPDLAESNAAIRALLADGDEAAMWVDRYVRYGSGYLLVSADGAGRFLPRLPDGVDPASVPERERPTGTALRDRLVEIERGLRAAPASRSAIALADAVARIVAACEPGFSAMVFAQLKQRAMAALLESGPAGAREFLDEMTPWIQAMRAQPVADGLLTARLLIVRDLTLAMAEAAGAAAAEVISGNLGYVAAPGPAPLNAVVEGLCLRALRHGYGPVLRATAEALKARGDKGIRTALDAGLDRFYPPLFEAASYELAAVLIGRVGFGADPDPTARRRWEGLANNAEERAARIAGSLDNAVANLDGTAGGLHRERVRELRRTAGEEAARSEARDLVLNKLFYPRAALPILLDDGPAEARDTGESHDG